MRLAPDAWTHAGVVALLAVPLLVVIPPVGVVALAVAGGVLAVVLGLIPRATLRPRGAIGRARRRRSRSSFARH